VPLFIPPVEWQASWGLYRRQDLTGDVIVDGGFVSNFPIELFLSREELVTGLMGRPEEAAGVLGFLLDETLVVPGAPPPITSYWQNVLSGLPGLTVLDRLIETMFRAREKQIIDTASEPHIVRLPAMGYAPFSLDLTYEQIRPLLNAGYNTTTAYLQSKEIHPLGLLDGEDARQQVDHTARQIINVYGNLNVHQEIGEVSGTATGVAIGSDD
jgi:predicted acylesterase/phospholipase RssA